MLYLSPTNPSQSICRNRKADLTHPLLAEILRIAVTSEALLGSVKMV